MTPQPGAERARQISTLYVMAKAVALDGLRRGYPGGSVRNAVAAYCYCNRNGLDIFAAHEILQAAMTFAALEWIGDAE